MRRGESQSKEEGGEEGKRGTREGDKREWESWRETENEKGSHLFLSSVHKDVTASASVIS